MAKVEEYIIQQSLNFMQNVEIYFRVQETVVILENVQKEFLFYVPNVENIISAASSAEMHDCSFPYVFIASSTW